MLFKLKNRYILFILTGFVLSLSGCSDDVQELPYADKVKLTYAQDQEKELQWPQIELRPRLVEYWFHRFFADADAAWQIEAPHFRFMTENQKYENYLSQGQASFPVYIQVNSVKGLTDYRYEINLNLSFSRRGQEHSVQIKDHWVLVRDQWYHIIRDPIFFAHTM